MSSIKTFLSAVFIILEFIRASQQVSVEPCSFPTDKVRAKIVDVQVLPVITYCQEKTDKCLHLNGNGKLTGLRQFELSSTCDSSHSAPYIEIVYEKLHVTFDSFGNDEQHEKWESPDLPLTVRVYLNPETECQIKNVREVDFYQVNNKIYQCEGCTLFNEADWKNVKTGLMNILKIKYLAAVKTVMKAAFPNIKIC